MSRPVLLDRDPGQDEAVAILLALGSPQVQLLGSTTCFGNCTVADATRNAQRVLALAGREDVPVAVGAAGPMRGDAALGNHVHGASGLDGPPLPWPTVAPVAESAHDFLRRTLTEADAPVTVVVTGPVTNLGTLLSAEPGLVPRIAELVLMGGSTDRGNHTPTAGFDTYERIWEFSAPPVHDPCTIAALLDDAVIGWRDAFVAVELDGTWTRGTTVVDLHHRYPERAPNASVAMHLRPERYWELVPGALDRLGTGA